MSFWDIIWFIIVSFAFIAYLMVLFNILTDLFRDKDVSGWVKAIWVICLIIFPFLTALVYLIARGRGMAERQSAAWGSARAAQDEYIKSVAGSSASPTEQIAKAQELLTAGAITQAEFDTLKAKALA
ncbi:putative oligomerization/nucleic acid binding protein [Kribbella orskensis]|uniref:Oligomerization/nucleic acid binding protein n=1 Tax=Kribbella orskensis TaxID=2512216 RepID=A0ABY2BVM7_9ACTN|nr:MULTISPECIES: SHOCT domain-containing protein [Kribbella]TCN43921.1 putative oligomerization/nucleic acid binding protein [Kribbella sp. VKM Ac-2500]TCO32352.1 putative oligomerization/nucleic acid binding protein [Kribbella orskensis]